MRKVLGFALAMLFALPLAATAEVMGTVKAIDRADNAIILDDGTRLTVSESQLSNLAVGDQVRATYHTEAGKSMATDLVPRGFGSDERGTTNWGPAYGTELNSVQSE